MVDIQSGPLRLGEEKERRKKKIDRNQLQNIASASATQGGHKKGLISKYLKCKWDMEVTYPRYSVISTI